MLRKLILMAVVVVGMLLAYAATRPAEFLIQRTVTIDAPAERVFLLINDLDNWRQWSPWEDKDPAMRRERAGADEGPGSTYAWSGNAEVGTGRMEITGSESPRQVVLRLDFAAPMEAHNQVEFLLAPSGTATQVTWSMTGRNNFLGKLAGMFIDVEGMVGRDFETGLANLKQAAES